MQELIDRVLKLEGELKDINFAIRDLYGLKANGETYCNNSKVIKTYSIQPDFKEEREIMVKLPTFPRIVEGKLPTYLQNFESAYDITYACNHIRKYDKDGSSYYEDIPTNRIYCAILKGSPDDYEKVPCISFRYKFSIDNVIAKLTKCADYIKERLEYALGTIEMNEKALCNLRKIINEII